MNSSIFKDEDDVLSSIVSISMSLLLKTPEWWHCNVE